MKMPFAPSVANTRRKFMLSVAAVIATGRIWAQQPAYPERVVTLIVPFAAGGPTDVTARIFAREIAGKLGQSVIVDNRPGAGGLLGGGAAARAKADGYTLLWGGTSTMAVAPSLYAKIPYDPLKSFQPISRAVKGPLVLIVNGKLPAKNLQELVAFAKENPDKINYGSAGVGSIIHLTGELLRVRAGIHLVHIPFKGNGEVFTEVVAGRLQMAFVALGQMLSHMKDGGVRAIAITSLDRNPLVPNLPTIAESGYEGFESIEWFGLVAPKGIPEPVLEKLSLAFRHASKSAAVKESVARLGYLPVDESPEQFTNAIKVESAKWKDVVVRARVRVE